MSDTPAGTILHVNEDYILSGAMAQEFPIASWNALSLNDQRILRQIYQQKLTCPGCEYGDLACRGDICIIPNGFLNDAG